MTDPGLRIPDIADNATTLHAALAYADAGWYVLPVAAGTKNPGSVVGKQWPAKSSRDPEQIIAWWAGTDHGIALHVGRSAAIVFDVDHYEHVPDEVLVAIETTDCPHQSTRPDEPGRGHYVFANHLGRRVGNGLGALKTSPAWGEIRGAGGVIIAAPTPHPGGGRYRWVRTGSVPPIPDYLADALPGARAPEDTASDIEVAQFLDAHTASARPEALRGLTNALTAKLRAGESCHMSTLGVLVDAMAEAAAGMYPARDAVRALWAPYAATATTGTSTGRALTYAEARREYAGIVAWAVGQAEGLAGEARQRVGDRYRDAVVEVDPADIVPDAAPDTVGAVDVAATADPDAPDAADTTETRPQRPAAATETGGGYIDTEPPGNGASGALEAIEGGFWAARPSLALIYRAALAQMCSPWAVLAVCVARTLALVPPTVTLPPVIGGPGSLNWFSAIVARSGGGKGAASAVAADLVPGDIVVRGAGSGEGMIEAYARRGAEEDWITSVLFSVDEVDAIASLAARSGQTTMSVLRSGFSGETLGFSYRGRVTERVEAHTYRMTLVVAVQPERAGGLFADAAGGTPQRFMWFPGRDKRIRAFDRPEWPTDAAGFPQRLPPPPLRALPVGSIDIPDIVADTIRLNRQAQMTGDDALDGHALFAREKLAFALALLDGRAAMSVEDWELSGVAAAVSDWCRDRAQAALEAAKQREAAERGALRGVEMHEADIARAVAASAEVTRILRWAVRKLGEAGGRMSRRDLSRAAASRDRARLTDAMLAGVEAGVVRADGSEWVLL